MLVFTIYLILWKHANYEADVGMSPRENGNVMAQVYNTIRYTIQYNTIHNAQYNTMDYKIQYNTMQYTIEYNTLGAIQYNTVP